MHKDNLIGKQPDQDDIQIFLDFKKNGNLANWPHELITWDMVQSGYPRPDHGEMIPRVYGGTDQFGRLLPGKGKWVKVEDVNELIQKLKPVEPRKALMDMTHEEFEFIFDHICPASYKVTRIREFSRLAGVYRCLADIGKPDSYKKMVDLGFDVSFSLPH